MSHGCRDCARKDSQIEYLANRAAIYGQALRSCYADAGEHGGNLANDIRETISDAFADGHAKPKGSLFVKIGGDVIFESAE